LFDNVCTHVGEETLQLSCMTHDRFLVLELTAPVSVLPAGDRSLIETGEETALEHGSGLGVAQAHLVVESVGGTVATETIVDGEPASALRIELPRARGDTPFHAGDD
jgi:hypothetical protein